MSSKLNLDDYSPSSTIIKFDAPLPLLRSPIPSNDSSSFILAFASPASFFAAYNSSKSNLTNQCNAGARIGCSIAATEKCKPKWHQTLFTRKPLVDYKSIQKCEELEMEGCVAAAKKKCDVFAKDKCLGPFKDARVVVTGRESAFVDVIGLVSFAGRNEMLDLIAVRKLKERCSTDCLNEVRCVRGSQLLMDLDHNGNSTK